ncbi:MAG TPA: methyltransferase domain-containing protein [Acidimicrobiales bacterium]
MTTETFQISLAAAQTYEARFVPALFAEWAPLVIDAAGVRPGDAVLDVACGTGVVTREADRRAGSGGRVVGVDLNEAMLTVAREIAPRVEWRRGDAAALPLPDDAFDAVVCQSALMFFPDRPAALREMRRVARQGGTVVVQVWARLDEQPAYGPFVEVAARHAGPEAVDLLGSYWAAGDLADLAAQHASAGLAVGSTATHTGTARFPSVDELVRIEVESTPLADRIDGDTYAAIRAGAREVLAPFVTAQGDVAVPIVGHIVTSSAP